MWPARSIVTGLVVALALILPTITLPGAQALPEPIGEPGGSVEIEVPCFSVTIETNPFRYTIDYCEQTPLGLCAIAHCVHVHVRVTVRVECVFLDVDSSGIKTGPNGIVIGGVSVRQSCAPVDTDAASIPSAGCDPTELNVEPGRMTYYPDSGMIAWENPEVSWGCGPRGGRFG